MLANDDNAVSSVTYGELEYGACRSGNYQREKVKIGRFFDIVATQETLTREIWEIYGAARTKLEQAGERLADFDLLIASTAVVTKRVLVTRNVKHFSRFPGLKIYGN